MKLNAIGQNVATNSIRFGNALSTQQAQMKRQLEAKIDSFEGKKKTDYNITKVYQQAFPSSPDADLGIGYMNSSEAEKIYDKIKVQGNTDVIKFMPFGELTDNECYNKYDRTGPYDRSALSIGADMINIPDLATEKWGNILSQESLDELIEEHKQNGSEDRIDFKTTLGYKNQESIPVNGMLRNEAFKNFNDKSIKTPELTALRKEFKEFKEDKFYDDLFSRTALYPYLKDWGTGRIESIRAKDIPNLDGLEHLPNYNEMKAAFESGNPEAVIYQGNLFKNFDYDASETQELLYDKVKENYQEDIDFYKFKQFLASKAVDEGVQMVHDKGMLAYGDAAIGWSWPEVQAFPDAFKWKDDGSIAEAGFQKPALKYEDLLEHQDTQDTPAHKLLRAKQELVLRHFDGVREDVGWQYFHPRYANTNFKYSNGSQEQRPGVCDVIPKYIEQVAREIKGDDFDCGRIIYECDANNSDINLENPETIRAINGVGGKVILSTMHEHQKDSRGWGSLAFILENLGIKAQNIVLQCCNHDGETILEGLNNAGRVNERVGAMMRSLKLPGDQWWKLKDDNNFVEHVRKYVRGRFTEVRSSLTNAILVNELFGMTDRIDYHCRMDDKVGNQKDGKARWTRNWEENYDMQLTQNKAFNWGDVASFKAECTGKKNENAALYEAAEKFAAYESRNDGIHTTEQANNSKLGDLNILDMSLDEIRNLNVSV